MFFDVPKQVMFRSNKEGEEEIFCGIGYHNEIICGCCGGLFEVDEVEILEVMDYWVDFSNYIR